jgi:hypothetical protein
MDIIWMQPLNSVSLAEETALVLIQTKYALDALAPTISSMLPLKLALSVLLLTVLHVSLTLTHAQSVTPDSVLLKEPVLLAQITALYVIPMDAPPARPNTL